MNEVHCVAQKANAKSTAKEKKIYDRCIQGITLQPADHVLVRNLSEKGGSGKLYAHFTSRCDRTKVMMSDHYGTETNMDEPDAGRLDISICIESENDNVSENNIPGIKFLKIKSLKLTTKKTSLMIT